MEANLESWEEVEPDTKMHSTDLKKKIRKINITKKQTINLYATKKF